MPNPVILGVTVGGVQSSPTDARFVYRILKASDLSDRGGLRGVVNEPVFKSTINQGSASLALILDHSPTEINYGDVIRVNYPSGQVAGMWRHEGIATKIAKDNGYQITLVPLISEAQGADVNANYTTDATQPTAPLNPTGFDVPVQQGLTRTQHLKAGSITSDGIAYAYAYNNASVLDTLNQAITFGGPGWWWMCDHAGVVSLRNTSPYTHIVTMGREATAGDWVEDIHAMYNQQPVTGGQPANSTTSLTALAVDTNPSNPFSVPNIGRRTAPVYSDSSLLNQAAVTAVATSLLGYSERVSKKRKVRLVGYTIRRPQPGDAITMRVPDPDPSLLTNPMTVQGPFLVTEVTEHGATNVFDVVISADMVVPISAMAPILAQQQAIAKLMQNPPRSAISPDGTQGYIGPGPVSGVGPGTFNITPSAPVGLALTSGIDSIAQTNNAYVNATWSASVAADVVTGYELRWRKGGDTQYYIGHTGVTAFKAGGLIPGFTYGFSVRAQNDLGTYSPWSAEATITTGLKTTPPGVPTGLKGIRTPRGALVQWNGPPAGTDLDLQGYLLQVSVGGSTFNPINPSPDLKTSAYFVAATGTPQQTVLVFRVAAVDWSSNQSGWSTATANIPTDGTYFDEIMTGNLTATGTVTTGKLQTGTSGPRVELDNAGIRLYDGGITDWGGGPGVSTRLKSQDGSAFFKGTISASRIQSPTPSVNPNMAIDFTGAPVQTITDSSGTVRVQLGQLPDLSYGLIVNDSTGGAILDTSGLIQVVKQLVTPDYYTAGPFSWSTTTLTATGWDIPFTVARPNMRVRVELTGVGNISDAGTYGQLQVRIVDGVGTSWAFSSYQSWGQSGAVGAASAELYPVSAVAISPPLGIGTFHAQIWGLISVAGKQANLYTATMFINQYGK